MKEAEDALWGAASTEARPRPSQVQIHVEISHAGKPFVAKDGVPIGQPKSRYGYVAFPLNDKPENTVQEGVKFVLTISYPRVMEDKKESRRDTQAEVEAALWAWETFGGVGARTRRGFGALCRADVKLPVKPEEVEKLIRQGLEQHVTDGQWPKNVPHLMRQSQFKVTALSQDGLAAWQYLIKALKDFRQDRPWNDKTKRPGRSRWPEPEAIRKRTGQRLPAHALLPTQIDRFPRAVFGLPIIFQFKDQDRSNPTNPHKDPRQTTLQGANNRDRLASPLILRPFLCAGDKGVGLALILAGPRVPLEELTLKGAPDRRPIESSLTRAEAKQIPMLDGETDVLHAFLKTLRGEQP
jgi:CRISPR-associated protein Cmr1